MKYSFWWEFPGSPVVRTLRFTAKGMNSTPGQGTKILCAVWLGQKIKKRAFHSKTAPESDYLTSFQCAHFDVTINMSH